MFYGVCKSEMLWKEIFIKFYSDSHNLIGSYYDSCNIYYIIELYNLIPEYDNKVMVKLYKFKVLHTRVPISVNNSIMTHIPTTIGLLKHLQHLNLIDCNFKIIPIEIGLLTNLNNIYLYHNKIYEIPTTIGNLVNLKIFNFCHNVIKHIPTEIGLLCNLEVIDVSYNVLTNIPTEIGLLSKLYSLKINNNEITYLPTEMMALDNLHVFDLNNNYINDLTFVKELETKQLDLHMYVDFWY